MPDDTAALVSRVGRGDRDALAALVESLGGRALGLALRVTQNRAIAEEAVQDAFLQVWRTASRYEPYRGRADQWVLTLVHRRAVDAVRREGKIDRLADRAEPGPAPADPADASVLTDRRDRVRRALSQLSDVQREALTLAYFGGLTYREVAERLEIPEGTAKSRLRDGLIRLRELMDAVGLEGRPT